MRCRARFSDVRAAADEQTGRLRPGHARSSERPVRGRYGKAPHKGSTAAWPSGLGRGLQSPVRRFDSARRLQGVFAELPLRSLQNPVTGSVRSDSGRHGRGVETALLNLWRLVFGPGLDPGQRVVQSALQGMLGRNQAVQATFS